MRAISEIIVAGRNLADILRNADLSGADLSGADLSCANLRGADLSGANLSCTNLSGADLSDADLSGADLSGANLSGANLSDADLSCTNLSGADLSYANLSGADLRGADLSGANLSYANLSCTNLSGAENLLNPVKWLAENFEDDDLGYIVYKAIGNTDYAAPAQWKIDAGEIIEEVVNPLPTNDCGCGVNFGTLQWVKEYCGEGESAVIWRCRIRWIDLPGVVVPYNTTGKARCNRLELLETIG